MISKEIKESAAGKKSCTLCEGVGTYNFRGSQIFCDSCHSQEKIESLWKSIDSYIAQNL